MLTDSFAVGDGVCSPGARLSVGVLDVVIMQIQGSTLLPSLTNKIQVAFRALSQGRNACRISVPDIESIRSQSCFYCFNSHMY